LYHKNLFAHGMMTNQAYKDLVKLADSLRSQVSKNACLTVATIYNELTAKECDQQCDLVTPTLLKRATDTNQFISAEAEKALIAVIQNCSEGRIFSCLQNQNLKSNGLKEKILFCYSTLIERLGPRLKNYRDCERLVQTVAAYLDQGAVEVRNQAKLAILTIQSQCGGPGREFEGLLLKCRLSERQMDKIKKVVANEDFESLSSYAATRYGASMRASPMV
jgi:hypothetical protein